MNVIRLGGNVIRLQTVIQGTVLFSFFMINVHAVPMISKINNRSNFGFVVFSHNDSSSCSAKNQIIQPQSQFNQALLLESIKSSSERRSIPELIFQVRKKFSCFCNKFKIGQMLNYNSCFI